MAAQMADWAIAAEAECKVEGHARFMDGRCVRCRAYAPTPTATAAETAAAELREAMGTTGSATGHNRCTRYTQDQGCPLHGETCQG